MLAYFHIAAVNDWERIVSECLGAMRDSGLYDELDEVRVGIVGHPLERAYVRSYLRAWKKAEVVAEDDTGWEQTTLVPLWAASQCGDDGPVLYLHTKGVWNQSTNNEAWRTAMIRHLVTEWRRATALLEIAEVVGSHRLDDIWPYETPEEFGGAGGVRRMHYKMHVDSDGTFPFDPDDPQWAAGATARPTSVVYAGNWWWTTMAFLRTLPPPALRSRYDAELWFGNTPGHAPTVVVTQPGWPTGPVGKSLWKDSGSDPLQETS